MSRSLFVLVLCLLLSAASAAAQTATPPPPTPTRHPVDRYLVDNLEQFTDGAITGSGGVRNLGTADEPGSTYARVIVADSRYLRNGAEIGREVLIERGVLQAVDVFGLLPSGESILEFSTAVEVCLRGEGELYFLNALTQPRRLSRLVAESADGYLCAEIANAGTLVLVNPPRPRPGL